MYFPYLRARQFELIALRELVHRGSDTHRGSDSTFGDFACLSFNGNKMITTSGGGALVCSSADEAGVAKFLATQARDNAPYGKHPSDKLKSSCFAKA